MALITSPGFAHVRLTVTDIARSKDFYDRVFGWSVAVDMSSQVDEPGVRQSPEQFYGGVVYQTPSGALFGLRPVGGQHFDSEHTGLDHVSFMVGSRDDLVDAQRALDEAKVEHERSGTSSAPGWRSCRSPTQTGSISSSARRSSE